MKQLSFPVVILVWVVFLMWLGFRMNTERCKEIAGLESRIDALQLVASGRIEVPEYVGIKTIKPKVIKY